MSDTPSLQRPVALIPTVFQRLWRFITSISLCVVLLLWLIILTLLGTFSQTTMGLYDSQVKYFDSLIFREEFYHIPLYLPGAYLVLCVLFVNLLLGGLIRLRLKPKNIGVFLSHCSILLLILAGWRSFHAKKEGHMAMLPNTKTDLVQAYQDWQLEIREEGAQSVEVIKDTYFNDCAGQKSRTFYKNGLPFQIKISEYARNAVITEEGTPELPQGATACERFAVLPRKVLPQNEANRAGLMLELLDANTNESITKAVLGGTQSRPGVPDSPPLAVTVKDKTYAIELTRERWSVPFNVQLDEFIIEKYDGLDKPKVYQSNVTKISSTGQERVNIGMNEPMRRNGYVFFQSGFDRNSAEAPYFTVLTVVNNPSDQWPAYACMLAGAGLCLHFLIKLSGFLSRTAKKRHQETAPAV